MSGPIKIGSFESPEPMSSVLATFANSGMKVSAIDASTMIRRVHEQR